MTNTTLTEITEREYEEALSVLPPAVHWSTGFLQGEPTLYRQCAVSNELVPAWPAYFTINGHYYAASEPLTGPEFRLCAVQDLLKQAAAAQPSPELLSGVLANA